MQTVTETIAAVATAQGRGGVGIVRVSGPLASQLAQAICQRKLQPRYAHYGPFFADGEQVLRQTLSLDDASIRQLAASDGVRLPQS